MGMQMDVDCALGCPKRKAAYVPDQATSQNAVRTMSPLIAYLIVLPILMLIFAGTWAYQRFPQDKHDAGIVDVVWALSTGLGAVLLFFLLGGEAGWRPVAVAIIVLWALRLAGFMWRTRLMGHKGEDTRYQHMRTEWGERVQLWFFIFYQVQAVAAWLLVIGFVPLMATSVELAWPWVAGALVVGLGSILGEHLADNQLAAFKADPANQGKVCRTGLWAYSRHPNYFFEVTHWFSYAILGFGLVAAGQLWGLLPLIPFALIAFLLTRVTGIPNNEAQNLRSKGDAYRQYREEVSAFFPWFPKQVAAESQATEG